MAGLLPFGGPFGGQQPQQGGVGGQGWGFQPQQTGAGFLGQNMQGIQPMATDQRPLPPPGMTEPPWMRNFRDLFSGGGTFGRVGPGGQVTIGSGAAPFMGGGGDGSPAQSAKPLFGTSNPWGQGPGSAPWLPGGQAGQGFNVRSPKASQTPQNIDYRLIL